MSWLAGKMAFEQKTMTALRYCDSAKDVLLDPRARKVGKPSAPSATCPFAPRFPALHGVTDACRTSVMMV